MNTAIISQALAVPERRGQAWSEEEEKKVIRRFRGRHFLRAEMKLPRHQRTSGGIRAHLMLLGLLDDDGNVITPRPDFTRRPKPRRKEI